MIEVTRSRSIGLRLLAIGALPLACDFPISTSKYSASGAPSTADPVVVQQLVAAFAESGACEAALGEKCALNLEQCATSPACIELTNCVRSEPDPAAETRCVDRLGTSLDAHWQYETLRACWAEQYAVCSVGNDFSCAEDYPVPSAERSELLLAQAVRFFGQPTRPTDFVVKVCGLLTDCGTPLAQTRTDPESGRYAVTIDVNAEPGSPGIAWEGYRLVEAEEVGEIPPIRIETNIPVWGRRVDVVQVFDRQQTEALAALYEAESTDAILVQVLDCQSGPAARIELSLPLSETGRVGNVGEQVASDGRSVTDGRGAAAIYDIEVGVRQEIVARRITDDNLDGEVVARWEGVLPAGSVMYLKMYPEGM